MKPDPSVLDADVLTLLNEGMAPLPMQEQAHQRVKLRLLQRIARDQQHRHSTVAADQGHWRAMGEGLEIKVLHRDGDVMSYLVRMAAGARLPAHRHPMDEECVVLEGAVCIGALRVAAGGYHLGARDALHDVIESPEGALIFLRGAVPDAELNI